MTVKRILLLTSFFIFVSYYGISAFTSTCPKYWTDATYVGMGCLYFNTTHGVPWHEAQHFCSSLTSSGHLVEIFSTEQQEFLQMRLYEMEVLTGKAIDIEQLSVLLISFTILCYRKNKTLVDWPNR